MCNGKRSAASLFLAGTFAVLVIGAAGCGKKEEEAGGPGYYAGKDFKPAGSATKGAKASVGD